MPFATHAAFRCKNCGHLESAEQAGVSAHPHACSCCSAGATFDAKGNKTLDSGNWEVLSEATPERLQELGLAAELVKKHEPSHDADALHEETRAREALELLEKKEASWKTNRDALVSSFRDLDIELAKLEARAWSAANDDAIDKTHQLMRDIENQEFTADDAARMKKLRDRPQATAKHVSVFARERTTVADES